jgi:hypothetical protein
MPIFYFHVFNSTATARDSEGADVADIAAAIDLARDSIRSIVAEEARTGRIDLNGHIDIADRSGTIQARVDYRDAFDLNVGGEASG